MKKHHVGPDPLTTVDELVESFVEVAIEHGLQIGRRGHVRRGYVRVNRLRAEADVITERLWGMGADGRNALGELLDYPDPDVRLLAALALLTRETPRAERALLEFEREPPGPRRAAAYGALLGLRLGIVNEAKGR